jgi:hypothetical protein
MMPSTSKKQHNFMEAIAHSPSFAKKVGVPQSVGKDFSNADKGKTFKRGGEMATKMDPRIMAMMMAKKKAAMGGAPMGGAPMGGAPMASAAPMGGGMGMKKGGMSMAAFEKSGKDVEKKGVKEGSKADMAMDKKQMMMKKGGATKKMASGGSASSRADGIAQRGKTKGKMLNKGGMAC